MTPLSPLRYKEHLSPLRVNPSDRVALSCPMISQSNCEKQGRSSSHFIIACMHFKTFFLILFTQIFFPIHLL